MLQDLAVVPLLILIDILGRPSGGGLAALLGVTLLKSAVVVTSARRLPNASKPETVALEPAA